MCDSYATNSYSTVNIKIVCKTSTFPVVRFIMIIVHVRESKSTNATIPTPLSVHVRSEAWQKQPWENVEPSCDVVLEWIFSKVQMYHKFLKNY